MSAVDSLARARQLFRSVTLYNFYRKYTKAYTAVITAVALIGYAWLLMFPAVAVLSANQFYLAVQLPFNSQVLATSIIWFSVTLLCAGISYSLFTLKFKGAEGIPLTREKAQLIFDKIDEIEQTVKWPKIDEVVLSRRFELNIIKTPKRYAPFWSKTTLVIGYPLLQTLSPEFFNCALTRKILQYAKRNNLFINWLSFLRTTWELYPAALKERNKIGDQLSYVFFRFYSWLYRKAALYITQLDELQADSLALKELNDTDLLRTVESIRLVQKLLSEHYWPKLSTALQQASASPEKIKPYEHLPKTTAQMMNSGIASAWLEQLAMETDSEGSHEPAFSERMDMMGQRKLSDVRPLEKSAAEYYFGPTNPKRVAHMNKLWAHHVKLEFSRKQQTSRFRKFRPATQQFQIAF